MRDDGVNGTPGWMRLWTHVQSGFDTSAGWLRTPGKRANREQQTEANRRAITTTKIRRKMQRDIAHRESLRRITSKISWGALCQLQDAQELKKHFTVQHVMEAVWPRKYETIITADMRYLVAAGYGVPALQMMQSARACILDSEWIVHFLARKDLAKCRDSAVERVARVDDLLMVCGSVGPGVLFPFSKRRYVRPGEPEHVTVRGNNWSHSTN